MKKRIQKIAHKGKAPLSVCILAGLLSAICFVSVSTAENAKVNEISGTENAQKNETTGAENTQKADDMYNSAAEPKNERKRNSSDNTADAESGKDDTKDSGSDSNKDGSLDETPVTDLDKAVGLAVLSRNEGRYSQGECAAEGHIILDQKTGKDGQVTVYALTMYGEYAFHDNYFIKDSGTGSIPAVIRFSYDDRTGYVLNDYQLPMDGGEYSKSIRGSMGIPEHLWDICISPDEESIKNLDRQEQRYAKRYLKTIGREAPVGRYSDTGHPLLTDAGVSIQVSNKLCDASKYRNSFQYYPDWIGNLERIEDGVRYVYEMALDKKAGEIIYTKSVYDTGEIIEKFAIDMETGEEL